MGLNVDIFTSFLTCSEYYYTIDKGEESVVLTHAYVKAGVMLSAALTLDDVAGFTVGSTKDFDAEAFAF